MMKGLPQQWDESQLDDLLIFVLGGDWGKGPEHNDPNYAQVKCIRASEIRDWDTEKGSTAANRKIKRSSLQSRELQENDIIIEISGGGPEQPVGRTVVIDKGVLIKSENVPKVCTNFFRVMRPSKEINSSYLNLYLQHFYASGQIREYQGGSNNLRNLRFNDYVQIEIPIAPFNEQKRIVAKIEELFSELDKGMENLKTAREQLKVYRQAVLKHAFEGKLTADWREKSKDKLESAEELLERIKQEREDAYQQQITEWKAAVKEWEQNGKHGKQPPKPSKPIVTGSPGIADDIAKYCTDSWTWLKLCDISEVSGGLTKNQKRNALPRKMKYLRVANVYADKLLLDEVAEIGVTDEEFRKVQLVNGDLLVVEGNGSIDQIGRLAVWNCEIETIGHQNHLIRVRMIQGMLPRFFLLFLLSPLGRKFIIKQANSTSGLHTLSISKVSGLPVPVPSFEEQEAILIEVEEILSKVNKMEGEIHQEEERSEALRQSILKRAFSGKLVPQDPKDEPASVLLERIRAEKSGNKKRRSAA